MGIMASAFWEQVVAGGLQVPKDRPLDELTAELVAMLGSPDPALRDDTAYATLATWIGRGVYDDLLAGLGDGMAAGLEVGLGQVGADSIFRRSFSALILGECVDRHNIVRALPAIKALEWGDRIATWFIRERDLRGFVDGKGWAHAVAHGADAIGALGRSPDLGLPELTVMLDVLADRLLLPTDEFLVCSEPDRMAMATMDILRRNLVPLSILEPWVARLAGNASTRGDDSDRNPFLRTFNVQAYLRALHLQLAIGAGHPDVRSDLLLVLVDALRATNKNFLRPR
jgi:hypothetical protein